MSDLTDPLLDPTATTDPLAPIVATVTTDQSDYAPGSTATITASGFTAGDDISFEITVIDPTTGAVLWSGPSWDALAGGDGSLLTSFFVSAAYADATIELTATDLTTGQVATDLFKDAPKPVPLAFLNEGGDASSSNGTAVGPDAGTNEAIFQSIATGPTGTGVIQSFVMIQQQGSATTEQGFNTDWPQGSQAPLDDKNTHVFDHSITLSQVPLVDSNDQPWTGSSSGTEYREFRLDINQDQNHPLISLDALRIYVAGTNDLSDTSLFSGSDGTFTFGTNADPVYDLGTGNWISIDTGPGSGHGDIAVLIPNDDFNNAITADVNHLLSGVSDPHVFLYSHFGDHDPVAAGGFEEWSLNSPPTTTSNYRWSLFKDVTVGAPSDASAGDPDTGLVRESNGLVGSHTDNLVDQAGQVLSYAVHLVNDATGDGAQAIPDIQAYDSLLGLYLPENDFASGGTHAGTGTYYWDSTNHDWTTASITDAVTVTLVGDTPDSGNLTGTTLEVGATWIWSYTYTVTQDEINNNGTNDAAQTDPLTNPANDIPTTNGGYGLAGFDDYGNGTQGYIDNSVTAAVVGTSTADVAAQQGLDGSNPNTVFTQAPVEWEPDWQVSKTVSVAASGDATAGDLDNNGIAHDNVGDVNGVAEISPSSNYADTAGQVITYTFSITSDGMVNIPLSDVEVKDSLLKTITTNGTTISPYLPNLSSDGSHVYTYVGDDDQTYTTTITVSGDLNVGHTATWEYTYVVTQTDLDKNGTNDALNTTGYGNPGTSDDGIVYTPSQILTQGYIDNTATAHSISDVLPEGSASAQAPVEWEPGVNIEKLVSVDSGAHWYLALDDNGTEPDADITAIEDAPGFTGTLVDDGSVPLAIGPHVWYEAVVTNTGNIDLTDVTLHDVQVAVLDGLNIGSVDVGQSVLVPASPTPGPVEVNTVSGGVTNTVSVTDDQHVTDSDSVSYTTPVPGLPGLTKGFWATHQYVWDGDGGGNTAATQTGTDNWWSGIAAPKSNPYGNEGQLYFPNGGGTNVISGPHDINPIAKLMLGDLNHDGLGDVTGETPTGGLLFNLDAAVATLNSSTTSDARLILGSQALAAQLNDYNIGHEPQGLIEAAVQWLSGSTTAVSGELNPLPVSGTQPGSSNNSKTVTASSNIDQDHNGIMDLNTDYTLSKGVITFKGTALSSSNDAWQKYVDIHDVGSVHYSADGNGLANALTAFNQGQLVIDTTGGYIEWAGSNDWHANTPGSFWEALNGHILGLHT